MDIWHTHTHQPIRASYVSIRMYSTYAQWRVRERGVRWRFGAFELHLASGSGRVATANATFQLRGKFEFLTFVTYTIFRSPPTAVSSLDLRARKRNCLKQTSARERKLSDSQIFTVILYFSKTYSKKYETCNPILKKLWYLELEIYRRFEASFPRCWLAISLVRCDRGKHFDIFWVWSVITFFKMEKV